MAKNVCYIGGPWNKHVEPLIGGIYPDAIQDPALGDGEYRATGDEGIYLWSPTSEHPLSQAKFKPYTGTD